MTTNQIRQLFIDYFKSKKHTSVASSSLIPSNDKTLLFTNAGMVQFKDIFLGSDKRDYKRAVTSQKCIRAGGKHNDLENVGYTARHLTFFEMLGNFSFGDYFKHEAIFFAWEFLTEVIKLPKEKLWITVFDEDSEAEKIWIDEIGIDPKRLSRIGAKDNFWSMGDMGPCGPCSEIFYDHGKEIAGGPPGSPDEDGDRYIEIWNLVFMQYNRLADGALENLPNPSVDTGMGIERLAAILQGVHSNYEIDVFQVLIKKAAEILCVDNLLLDSLKVIADHIRSCSFLIADGIIPANEGRGYVLRRIIRRAARHGYKLNAKGPFLYKLVPTLVSEMGEAYAQLKDDQDLITTTLLEEENQFGKTLEYGMKLLEQNLQNIGLSKTIPGEVAFKLYDTYGFPVDLTADIAREKGLSIDMQVFNKCMDAQKIRAKSANKFSIDYNKKLELKFTTDFLGYNNFHTESKIEQLLKKEQKVDQLNFGDEGIIILEKTPFYGESGGQIGDAGIIESFGFKFLVSDTQKVNNTFLHYGKVLKGTIKTGDEVSAMITVDKRLNIARNHSATHLLHSALREILGKHVVQKGSLVDSEKLRFDFTHKKPLTQIEIEDVEKIINKQIRSNLLVDTILTSYDHAQEIGAMALFGEKYTDEVRVVQMGDFSTELCGGTHVTATGEIGYFKIISEAGIAAGIRRIEANTGEFAETYTLKQEHLLKSLISSLKAKPDTVMPKVEKLLIQIKEQEKEITRLKTNLSTKDIDDSADIRKKLGEITIYSQLLPNVDMNIMRQRIDDLKSKNNKAIIILGTENKGKAQIAVGVSNSITADFKAGEIANFVAKQVGGKGGGRADMAQAGGSNPKKLQKAIASVYDWLDNK